jgi:tetratricopeptide (TPR) repeat protein
MSLGQDANRDIYNIEKLEGGVSIKNAPSPVQPRDSAEQDLLEVVKQQIESRLAGQLHHHVKLDLKKETQPQQVRPWRMEVKVAISQLNQLLPPEMTIGQVFEEYSGRLLILGEPGAGKTTSLLDLALYLVSRAEVDPQQRIPVQVDLSDWEPIPPQSPSGLKGILPRQPKSFKKNSSQVPTEESTWSISAWFATKVREKYGSCGIPPQQIEKWLQEKRLVPLLDGLDEVRPEYQQDCVKAINQWLNSDLRPRQVVLCCRREQYEVYPEKLILEGAVYIQDLADEQIQTFLKDANRAELWESLEADANLLALVRRPLLLSMAILAYEELKPSQWKQATSAGDRLNLLLSAYVRRMLISSQETQSRFYRKGKVPSLEQSQTWLEILALQLLQDSQTEFLIESMQPEWLLTPFQKWAYLFLAITIWGLICGITALAWYRSIYSFLIGLVTGIVWGIVEGENLLRIEPAGSIQISLSDFRLKLQNLFPILSFFILPGSIFTLMQESIIGFIYYQIIVVFPATVTVLLISKAKTSLKEAKISARPNQAVWDSVRNLIPIALIYLTLSLLAVSFLQALGGQPLVSPVSLWVLVLSMIVFAWLWICFGGGHACIKHFMLRLCLFSTGSISWNYAHFLNYATERLLLQRVGGRYRFIHDLLRQSLANARINTHPHIYGSHAFASCGDSYRLMGQHDSALQNLDRAIELNPKLAWAVTSRGKTYQALKRYEEALQDFDRAIELAPNYTWAIVSRGETYQALSRYEEALKDFDRAIELDPNLYNLYWVIANRGETYQALSRYEEALQDFDQAIELDPNDTWAIANRSETYLFMKHYEESLKDLDQLIVMDSQEDWYRYLRTLVYLVLQQTDLAKADLDNAIYLAQEKHTENPEDCRNTFNLMLYHLVAGNLPIAKTLCHTTLQNKPSQIRIRAAIKDLAELLKILSGYPAVQQIKDQLEEHLFKE